MIASILMAAALAATQGQPVQSPILSTPCEFGVVHPWTTATCSATVTNTSEQELVIEKLTAAHLGTAALNLPLTVQANGSAQLKLSVDVGSRTGVRRAATTFDISGGDAPMFLSLPTKGFVYSLLDQVRPAIEFNVVDARSHEPRSIRLTSVDDPDLKVSRIESTSDFVDASVAKDSHTLDVSVKQDAGWGLQTGEVVVVLNSLVEPEAHIAVRADVHGRVVPNDNPFAIGVLRTGNKNEVIVQLNSRDGEPFNLGEVSFERLEGKTRIQECAPAAPDCKLLVLTIGESQPRGFVSGLMHIDILPDDKTLTIGFEGLLLSPTTEIRSLNDEAQTSQPKLGAESAALDAIAFGDALKSAMRKTKPPPAPSGHGPILRWEVANQQTLYGYLIYRAPAKDGPFQRVNDKIVRVMDKDSTNSYVWRDTSAKTGETYWYYISSLANNGEKTQLSGKQEVTVKKGDGGN